MEREYSSENIEARCRSKWKEKGSIGCIISNVGVCQVDSGGL